MNLKDVVANQKIEKLLSDKKKLLTEIYIELQKAFEERYGHNTVVFMEIGTFFEVYEVNNDVLKIGKAKEMAELLNIQLTKKNKSISENSIKNPLLAGVPSVSFERYLNRVLQEQKYTVVVIKQRGEPPHVSRYLSSIISPGTNFDYTVSNEENYIVSLLIDKNKDIFSIGYSAIDVTTGKTYLYEAHGTSEDVSFALDEVFNLLHVFKTTEVVLTFMSTVEDQKEILRYLEIEEHYHYSVNNKRPKIEYQNQLFGEVYQIKSLLSPIEHLDLERSPLITEALAVLMDFIIEHDYKIMHHLSLPTLINNKNYMYLGNNALEQLDIVSKDKDDITLLRLIDNTATAIGKRLLKERLLHPIIDEEELNRRYNLTDKLCSHVQYLEAELRKVYDLERILRRITLQKLHPFEINFLHSSLCAVLEIARYIKERKIEKLSFSELEILEFIEKIEESFDLSTTAKFTANQIEENFFLSGVDKQIDVLVEENRSKYESFKKIAAFIDAMINKATNKDTTYVSINQLDKEGFHLSLTKNRFALIESQLLANSIELEGKVYSFRDFSIKRLTNSVKIGGEFIETLSDSIIQNQNKIVGLVKERFHEKLSQFEHGYKLLIERVISFISDLDVALSGVKLAKEKAYCRPEVIECEESFVELIELRHPLIEAQEVMGIYVPNDITLGKGQYIEHKESVMYAKETTGILLYGINSSGKSSLMKSVGIALILAQAGFFVPAKKMRFSLLHSLFTRIVSKDNLTKGLSTFAVEMLELKNIFNRAGGKSIVLGDEISHGTETLSGVSIVASAIMKLSKLQSMFIFATHLHQLANMKEMHALSNVMNLHLGVSYDEEEDKLVFDRKLQKGSGKSIYGLEFARSLHMDKEFLKNANAIRKNLAKEYSNLELLGKKKSSKYNKGLYLTKCIICQERVDDVHHIAFQQDANENKMIGHFHQDHRFNLLPLCKKHHQLIHEGKIRVQGFMMTSKGLELHYEEVKDES